MNKLYAIICLACNARPNAHPSRSDPYVGFQPLSCNEVARPNARSLRSDSYAGFPNHCLATKLQDPTPAHRVAILMWAFNYEK